MDGCDIGYHVGRARKNRSLYKDHWYEEDTGGQGVQEEKLETYIEVHCITCQAATSLTFVICYRYLPKIKIFLPSAIMLS